MMRKGKKLSEFVWNAGKRKKGGGWKALYWCWNNVECHLSLNCLQTSPKSILIGKLSIRITSWKSFRWLYDSIQFVFAFKHTRTQYQQVTFSYWKQKLPIQGESKKFTQWYRFFSTVSWLNDIRVDLIGMKLI